MGKNFVITVARGFGSGGKQIAAAVAKELGIRCYEHAILTLASQMSGLDRARFAEADEKLTGNKFIKTIKENFLPEPKDTPFASDDQLFEYQSQIIRGLAASESCVIVGKCADYVLRDHENVFSFYIEAPRAYCVANLMSKMEVTEEEANRLIAKTDKYRADYYRYYTGGNYWTNPVNFDMTLNSERVGKENCVKLIKDYVTMRMGLEG